MQNNKTALILGVSGGIGGAMAEALLRHGWSVRGLSRSKPGLSVDPKKRFDWIQGDAMSCETVSQAASGVSTIIHAVNPADYLNWDQVVLPMLDNTIKAARQNGGARIVLPGTIYNYDPARTPVIKADTPQNARSRKGRMRIVMEERLKEVAPYISTLILRGGDFFGPNALKASWFARAMVPQGKPIKRIINIAKGGGHTWAYVPDFAETIAQLLNKPDQLGPFRTLQFEGYYDHDGQQVIESIKRVVGKDLPTYQFPWWLVHAISPINQWAHEASEIAPYWRNPVRLDNTQLVELLGEEPRRDLDQAIRECLVSFGTLEPRETGQLAYLG